MHSDGTSAPSTEARQTLGQRKIESKSFVTSAYLCPFSEPLSFFSFPP